MSAAPGPGEPADGAAAATVPSWAASVGTALVAAVAARVLVAGTWLAVAIVSDELRPGLRPFQHHQGLLAWDGRWYADIAAHGYGPLPAEALRFFPLLPLAGRLVGWITPLDAVGGTVVVANLAAVAATVAVHRLVVVTTGDGSLADRTVWLWTLAPAGIALVLAYTEGLLVLAAAAAVGAATRERWGIAAVAGFAAGLARPVGLLVAIPVAVAASGRRPPRLAGLAAAGGPVAGCAAYLGWAWVATGDALAPFATQGELRGDVVLPPVRIAQAVGEALDGDLDGLHLPFVVAAVVLAGVAVRRTPAAWSLWAAANLVVALAAENLNSFERYALAAFPLTVALAAVARGPRRFPVALATSAGTFVVVATLTFAGAYVP